MALDPSRRDRILDAATILFSAYGYRRTSMELLAREAEVAKPTVYAYFADKESVFVAVVDQVLKAIVVDARAAALGGETLEDRLTAVLDAKFGRLYTLVHRSPHAAELLSSSDEAARALTEQADADYRRVLTSIIAAARRAGQIDLAHTRVTRGQFVDALLLAGHGADALAQSSEDHHGLIHAHVRLLLAGVTIG